MSNVKEHFESKVDVYKQNFSSRKSGKNFNFLRRLEIVSNISRMLSGNLLDCACGSGDITLEVVKQGNFNKIDIVDISKGMVNLTKSRIDKIEKRNVSYFNSDIFDFVKNDNKEQYDLILALGLIAHTGRIDELLKYFKESVSEDGLILIQSSLINHPMNAFVKTFLSGSFKRQSNYRLNYYSYNQLKKVFDDFGFEIVSANYYGLGIDFLDRYFAPIVFFLERKMKKLTGRYGSDVIFLLRKKSNK